MSDSRRMNGTRTALCCATVRCPNPVNTKDAKRKKVAEATFLLNRMRRGSGQMLLQRSADGAGARQHLGQEALDLLR